MNRITAGLLLGLFFISIGATAGYTLGWRHATEEKTESFKKAFLLTTAYAASLSLKTEIANHTFIKSGDVAVAEQHSLSHLDILIKQIENIDYSNTKLESEIIRI